MPSYCIHLAIGNLYAEKFGVKNKVEFDKGIIAPDFATDKEASHYGVKDRLQCNLVECLAKKVDLVSFLSTNSIDSDYKKGEFLHLITDYIYFTRFFAPQFVRSFDGNEFLTSMYYSYDQIKDYIEQKYKVVYPGDLDSVMKAIEGKRKSLGIDKGVTKEKILPIDKLDKFIKFCSSINLEKYKNKILQSNQNVAPDEGEFC